MYLKNRTGFTTTLRGALPWYFVIGTATPYGSMPTVNAYDFNVGDKLIFSTTITPTDSGPTIHNNTIYYISTVPYGHQFGSTGQYYILMDLSQTVGGSTYIYGGSGFVNTSEQSLKRH